MKIGIIETGIPPQKIGGAEKQAWQLAQELSTRHEVTIYTGRYDDSPRLDICNGVRIRRIGKWPKPFGIITYILGMVAAVFADRKSTDVLLCFRAWPNGAVGYLCQLFCSIPGCFSIRGGDWYYVKDKWWGKALYKLLFASPLPCVVQSTNMELEVKREYPDARLVIIPNGISLPVPEVRNGKDVVFLGNLLQRKGCGVLVRAMREIESAHLVIVGDGPERPKIESLSNGMKVTFLGKVLPEEAQEILRNRARVVVLPAIAGEGFPNVLMESMALSIPVIASDVAGISNLLLNGKAGIVVKPGDVAALRDAITLIVEDDDVQNHYAKEARAAVKVYHWDIITSEWERELCSLTKKCSN